MKPRILRFVAAAIVAAAIVAAILLLAPSPQPPPPPLIADTILDATTGEPIHADIYLNGSLTYQGVTHFQVVVPLDGSAEIHVVAPGYKPWGLRPRGGGSDKVLQGPVVKLTPE